MLLLKSINFTFYHGTAPGTPGAIERYLGMNKNQNLRDISDIDSARKLCSAVLGAWTLFAHLLLLVCQDSLAVNMRHTLASSQ